MWDGSYGYWWMMAGRAIFGIGGENQMVSGNCMIYTWFGDWVSFAFSVQQSAQILGQMANQFISPIINEHYGKDGF